MRSSFRARARNNLAAVNAETGTLTSWAPDPDGAVNTLALSPNGALLFAAGAFSHIGRAERDAAMFDTAAGFVLGWRPNAPFTGEAVATSLDGAELYLGGEGAFDVFRQGGGSAV
jgi:hypothetical protein